MRLSRRSRLVTALIALVSVLFMQLAAAAYACPTIPAYTVDAVSTPDVMADCDGMMDLEQPALCFAKSQEGNQSLYKPPVPDVQPAVAVELVPAVGDAYTPYRPVSSHAQASWLMRVSAPPVSIRNCCFRI